MIAHLNEVAGHLRDEFEVKYWAMQVEQDGLEARYVDAKDIFLRTKNKSKVVRAEHAEYERVIHKLGGSTISEVEKEVLKVVQRCSRYRDQSGPTSWECKE